MGLVFTVLGLSFLSGFRFHALDQKLNIESPQYQGPRIFAYRNTLTVGIINLLQVQRGSVVCFCKDISVDFKSSCVCVACQLGVRLVSGLVGLLCT